MEISVVPRKEMEANQPTNPESGEGHNQPEGTRTEPVISISVSLEERFRTLMDSFASVKKEDEGDKPLIGQVPILGMETELKKYFHPRFMSIGPVHHGKKELERGELYKNYLTILFIIQNRQSKEILYYNILKEIESFKKCYDHQELLKKFSGDDEGLAWMFFVDGCALIQFVCCYVECSFHDMHIARGHIHHVTTDLTLLDNQLPLGVLNLVMGFSKEGGELYQNDHLFGKRSKELRKSICRFIEMIRFGRWRKGVKTDSVTDESFKNANHFLELIWMNFIKKEKDGRYYRTVTPQHFCRVKELQAAGIRLNHSNSSLRNISFSWGFSLKISSLLVDEVSTYLLFNLIAYEKHPNFTKDLVVTSYIGLLNSLMATKEDVEELQKVGILINHLPNDQEVLNTFCLITSYLKPYPDIFCHTKDLLIKYFNDKKSMKIGKCLSEAVQVYFRSLWTTIAVISATSLLILTFIQTIFSVLAYRSRETI